jgi:TetR/AcrR family transcriptional regulator
MAARSTEMDVSARSLAAATRLFAKRGVEATSIQDIATEVGVTKPAVLHHFPSKEDLRRAVFASILDHWRERLPAILLAATASEDRFDGVLGELRAFFSADPDRARLVAREMFDRPDELRELMRVHVRPWIGAIVAYIDRGKARGEHHADVDAEAYVVHVLCFVISAIASETVALAALEAAGATPADARARFERELVRIARTSLFAGAAPKKIPEAARAPSPPIKPKRTKR